jgi:hypothetical protein
MASNNLVSILCVEVGPAAQTSGETPKVTVEFNTIDPKVIYQGLKDGGVRCEKDGDQWCCLCGPNLQEGIAGFGDTPDLAFAAFLAELGRASP